LVCFAIWGKELWISEADGNHVQALKGALADPRRKLAEDEA
jgi:hypothetical protein